MATQAPHATATLCQQIYSLMADERFVEASVLLEQHLATEPLSNKGLLGWTRLQCAQGTTYLAVERLTSPVKQFPENPYFKLACVEILLAESQLAANNLITMYEAIARCAGESASDIFAKIAHSASLQGLWSFALPYFLQAIKLVAAANPNNHPQNLILLYERNQASVARCLSEVSIMDHRGARPSSDDFSCIPLELLGRVLCILITAHELGIPEAAPVITRIASQHSELRQYQYKELLNLAVRYSPGWIGLQLPYEFSKPITLWN